MSSHQRSRLFLLCAGVVLAGPSLVLAQLSDVPVKAGLWEAHVTTKIGASSLDGGAAQVCFTAGTTLGDYLTASNAGAPGTKCDVSNKVNTAHGISYETVCTGASMTSKGSIDVQLTDPGHFNGSSRTTVTGTSNGKPANRVIEKTFSASFLAVDCGNVKPLVRSGVK